MLPAQMDYAKVLPTAQKVFSLRSVLRNGLPTIAYHLAARPLPPSEKITIFTCTIFPPLVAVWHHLVRKMFGDAVNTQIFDCSGTLDPALVPGAKVQRYINAMHPTKIDVFLKGSAGNRKLIWICDDDVFPVSNRALTVFAEEFGRPNTAMVSLRPRTHWNFDIGGKKEQPSGSYCLAIDRTIFIDREHLRAQPADGNMHLSVEGKPQKRYDTLDKANESLLQHGYRCAIPAAEIRDACVCGFNGTSIGALLLSYFRSPQDVVAYFDATTDAQWKGNALHRNFTALLAAQAVQDLFERITGKQYSLPTLPNRADLARIRKRTEPLLQGGRNYAHVDQAYERVLAAL